MIQSNVLRRQDIMVTTSLVRAQVLLNMEELHSRYLTGMHANIPIEENITYTENTHTR